MGKISDEVLGFGYRSLFFGHPDATFLFDLEGNFIDCNQSLAALVGRTRDEMLTMGFQPMVHPEFVDITADGFARALAGETSQYLTRGIRADGTFFDVDVTNIPLVDDTGHVFAVAGIARDVGHVQVLSDLLDRNVALLDMAGRVARFAGWSVDAETNTVFWSSELFRMFHVEGSSGAPPLESAIGMYPEPDRSRVEHAVMRCMTEGVPMDLEAVVLDGLGHQLYVRVSGQAIRDAAGNITRIAGGILDITRVRAEREERSRLEAALSTTLDHIQDPICFLDRYWRVTFANRAARELVGIPDQSQLGVAIYDLLPGFAPENVIDAYRVAMDQRTVARARGRFATLNRWLDLTAHPSDEGIALIFRDVTEEVAAELAAQERADRDALQASLFEISSNAIFTFGADGRIALWNQAAADLYECPIGDAIGQHVDDLVIHDGPPLKVLGGEELARTGRWSGQLRQKTRSGRSIIVNARAQRITSGPAAGSMMASNTDATEVETERAARFELESRLRSTLDQIQDGLCFITHDWRYSFVNDTLARYLRRDVSSLIGDYLWESPPGETGSDFGSICRNAMNSQLVGTAREYFEPLDAWFESTAYPTDEGIALYVRDVSKEEQSAVAMRQADVRARQQAALLDAARDAILVISPDKRIEYANRSARRLFGGGILDDGEHSASQALGVSDEDFDAAIATVLTGQEWDGELVHELGPDGPVITDDRWQLIAGRDGQPSSIFCVLTDVTAERRKDLIRHRDQRLESLGTLAGGIAHDLNNVLTPILMASQLLAAKDVPELDRALLNSIGASAQRGADMIRQVLSFARGTDGTKTTLDLAAVISDMQNLVQESLPKNVELTVEVGELDSFSGDSTQILQVLLNLVTNASDAMPHGGHIHITAKNATLDADDPEISQIGTDRCVKITVTDGGVGMDDSTVQRIFEPFFTTKKIGEGTGLGLATSMSILRSHSADMTVRSAVGRGTTFTLYLPVGAVASDNSSESLPPAEDRRGRGELILVVDDEQLIRQTVCETLRSHGYQTIEASDGREAIGVAESSKVPVDMVFTDMMMPVMDGAATARFFFDRYPGIAVVAASGLAEQGSISRASDVGVRFFLHKPFTTSELLQTVNAALHPTTSRATYGAKDRRALG